MQLKTKIGKLFFKLLDKHLPRNSALAKVFNRSKVTLSYSYMSNLLNLIKRHNTRLLQAERVEVVKTKLCNCRYCNNCPLGGECQIEVMVYSAKVSDSQKFNKTYIGYTEGQFKRRYYNHTNSLRLESHSNDTKLANCVWRLKEFNGRVPHIKWKIIKKNKAGQSPREQM